VLYTILLSPTLTIALLNRMLLFIYYCGIKAVGGCILGSPLGHVFQEFVRLRRELFSCTVALIAGLSEERL
jgi:hypothetical protein